MNLTALVFCNARMKMIGSKWQVFCMVLLMKTCSNVTGIEFPELDHIKPRASREAQTSAAGQLIQRIIGDKSKHFHVVIDENLGPKFRDTFKLVSDGEMVTIYGTSGVAASTGFYYYLKNYCGCQFTWAGSQLDLPSPLPVIKIPGITVTSNDRFRYYQNVCTVSYSFVWWDWPRWEREIDWMAMNGINLPLAFTGQEAIFQRVYMKLGFTFEDLQEFFGGPAFLAWARMGNMRGWGGPVPESWIKNQLALQHMILDRMLLLGMIPVLPAFAGHVPGAITRLYPNASVSRLGDWGHFDEQYCCTYLLDFEDDLFKKIGATFIEEMEAEFGIDHIYNADTFNENTPKSGDPAYLRSAGKAVYSAMIEADPQAVWLMQGWLFQSPFWSSERIEALLTSVPQGRMIVLDLMAEINPIYPKTHFFYGQPFIWCMLHNFGGTMELYGAIESINEGPFIARNSANSSMIGTGLTPEGIFQNEAMYEFMNENAYAKQPRNLTKWFTSFASSRYGQINEYAIDAWQFLKRSVFNNTDRLEDFSRNVIPTSRPSLGPLHPDRSVYNNTDYMRDHSKQVIPSSKPRLHRLQPDVWYNPADLYSAWKLLLQAGQNLSSSQLYKYDLVDVGRNSLEVLSIKFYSDLIAAYKSNNMSLLQQAGSQLLGLLDDLDELLGSDPHFLLGNWIRDARRNGVSDQDKDLMEFNARNQITLWGPAGNIRDYACKQWSGLVKDFYYERWNLFVKMLQEALAQGVKFNQTFYDEFTLKNIEQPFGSSKKVYPTTTKGDSMEISKTLFTKYQPVMGSDWTEVLKPHIYRRNKISGIDMKYGPSQQIIDVP